MESPKMEPTTQDQAAEAIQHKPLLVEEIMSGISMSAVAIMMSVIFVNFFSLAMEVPLT